MWKLSTYFKDGKVLGYTVILLLIEFNQHEQEYYLLPNTELE